MSVQTFRRRALNNEDKHLIDRAVARAKAGDQEAVGYIYVRYADNVYGYVRSIVRDDHDAEDVTQHVFTKLLTAISKYERRSVPFSAWILRVAHNVAVDHLRSVRSTPCEDVGGAETIRDDDAQERVRCLHEAFGSLPEEQRNVLVLRHVLGLSPGEIAERLGRTEDSVHGLHHRGRRAMQAKLTGLGLAPVTVA